jgi:hypothetical protein
MSGLSLDRTRIWFAGLVAAAVKREHIRVAHELSRKANEMCSCGGAGPDDPKACAVCLYYHHVLAVLEIEAEW